MNLRRPYPASPKRMAPQSVKTRVTSRSVIGMFMLMPSTSPPEVGSLVNKAIRFCFRRRRRDALEQGFQIVGHIGVSSFSLPKFNARLS